MKACPRCNLRYPDHATACFVDGAELATMRDPRIGTTLAGRYVIEEAIAEGGMATVYMGHERLMDRRYAIKILAPRLARNKVVRERFRREAKATQKLSHPNIIEIFDSGETDDGMSFMVMELLEGEPLADAIARGPMTLQQTLPIALQVARALARAHDFDVVHRDLKPENIFLCENVSGPPKVKLLDFGIARSLHDERLTSAGDVFGTPQYMAPERITSIDAGPSADLYALGVITFEMLAGKLPFHADDVPSFFAKHLKEPAPRLSAFGVRAPEALQDLVLALMAKKPEQRPVDARRVVADLTSISHDLGIDIPLELAATINDFDEPPPTLPPASIDRWDRRTATFEEMLRVAHGGRPPPAARALLDKIRSQVKEIRRQRDEGVAAQRKLTALESKARDGRQRFGVAVDALGLDVSRARGAARDARAEAEQARRHAQSFSQRMRELHARLVQWEGRTAFMEPYPELAAAYRQAAENVDAWLIARQHEQAKSKRAAELETSVTDLDYQLTELRVALTRLEQEAERERQSLETTIADLGRTADAMEQELLQLATDFCRPMRGQIKVLPLFQELELG